MAPGATTLEMQRNAFEIGAARYLARVKGLPVSGPPAPSCGRSRRAANLLLEPSSRGKGTVMSKFVLSGLVLGAAMTVGTAQAEPLSLTAVDLDKVTAAGPAWVDVDMDVWKNKHIKSDTHITTKKEILQRLDLDGFFADAEAGANCFGFACEALTMTVSDVDAFSFYATAYSQSESAGEGFQHKPDNKQGKF
jgi:hypothetical protein